MDYYGINNCREELVVSERDHALSMVSPREYDSFTQALRLANSNSRLSTTPLLGLDIGSYDSLTSCYQTKSMLCDVILRPKIKKVIYNPPATIVFWDDGEKTIVKCCEEDQWDSEKGLAMAICKKLYGKSFHKVFKDHKDESTSLGDVESTEDAKCRLSKALLEKSEDDAKNS